MENREPQRHSAMILGQEEGADGKSSEFRRNTEAQLMGMQQCWFLSMGKHIAATQDEETGEGSMRITP